MRVVGLDGEWEVRDALGDTFQWYVRAVMPDARNNAADAAAAAARAPGWTPASVPGSVIDALHAADELPDPRFGRNSRLVEWTADRHWVFRRRVDVPDRDAGREAGGPGHQAGGGGPAILEFDGIDPGARVYWDGELVGSWRGLYRRIRIDLGERATPGAHVLAVVVEPAADSEPQVGRTERVRIHSPRVGHGWDFCPRFRHQGIWRPVRLLLGGPQLSSLKVRATLDGTTGRVTGTVDVDGGDEVRVEVRRGDAVLAAATAVAVDQVAAFELELTEPELWHPAGLGPQTLHDVVVTAGDAALTREVGFRTAVLAPNPGAPDAALPYTAVVNGQVVPLVGWNWVPVDAQFGSIDRARLDHLLDLAVRSGARVLRVWGGGLVETDEFYAGCDRRGLLVWQEFSQSSSGMQSAPSDDPQFLADLTADAEQLVPDRAHHPSLLIWGGGNELDADGVPLRTEDSAALTALADVVHRLDPGRAWLPTSPTGPAFHSRLDVIRADPDAQHDVHGPWEHQGLVGQYVLGNAGTSLSHSEFGVEGMTNARSWRMLVPEGDGWPAGRENPLMRHLGEWWNNAAQVQELFGGGLDLERLRRASQFLQATGLGYAIEADRRRAPRCSIVLPWQLGESYPNAWCTSSVDYRGEPKPAYFAVQRAFARDRVTFRVDRAAWDGCGAASAEAWLWSEGGVEPGSRVTLRARDAAGRELAERTIEVARPVTDPVAIGSIEVALDGLRGHFFWEAVWTAADGRELDRELVVATAGADLASLFAGERAALEVTADAAGVTVAHAGGPAVIGLHLADDRPADAPGAVPVTGDPRPLLPGERRRFHVGAATGADASARPATASRRFVLESFTTDPITVELP